MSKHCPEDRCFKIDGHQGPHEAGNGNRWSTGGKTELPTGILWSRSGGMVIGTVIVVNPDESRREVATVRYTPEQAARVASQLLSAMGGKR